MKYHSKASFAGFEPYPLKEISMKKQIKKPRKTRAARKPRVCEAQKELDRLRLRERQESARDYWKNELGLLRGKTNIQQYKQLPEIVLDLIESNIALQQKVMGLEAKIGVAPSTPEFGDYNNLVWRRIARI